MKKVLLNADLMSSESDTIEYLQKMLPVRIDLDSDIPLPDQFYAGIMEIKEPIGIEISDTMTLVDNLGRFGLGLIKMLEEASEESDFVEFELD